jgi:spermidine/putrescine transport system ATP-binding protein
LFRATIDSIDGDNVVASDHEGRYVLPRSRMASGVELTVGAKVLIGIRPEKLSIATGHVDASQPNHQNGVIRDASFFGVSTQYIVDTPSGDHWMVFQQNDGDPVLAPGTQVNVTWNGAHAFGLPGTEDVLAGDEVAAEFVTEAQ